MLDVRNLAMQFGRKSLFQEVDLILLPNQRYGLVGANGTGKSTFLKILAEEEQATHGTVVKAKNLKLGILKQDHFRFEEERLVDVVIQGNPNLWRALVEKNIIYSKAAFTEEDGYRLSELEEIIMHEGGYEAESIAKNLLRGLGIADSFHEGPLSALSGGYKLRVLLAQVLYQQPDIMLLDEPTNHLDIISIAWLEQFLQSTFKGVLVFISHDRSFLNAISTHILDIDYDTILDYPGDYDAFCFTKAERVRLRESELKNQEKRIEALQSFVDRFGAKASKASQAASRQKMIERIELVQLKESSICKPYFHFQQRKPTGKSIIEAVGIHQRFDTKIVLKDVTFTLQRGDKCAIVGPNGVGKSTLLNVLLGNVLPQQGYFQWSPSVSIAYFAQDYRTQLAPESTLWQWMTDSVIAPEQEIRRVLGQVLFSGSDVDKKISLLSGGESARLIIAKLILEKHNVLIFDEPTNHLDLESIDALIEAIVRFPGTVLFVSHNRYFIDSIANRVLVITEQHGVQNYLGNYKEYLEQYGIDYLTTT